MGKTEMVAALSHTFSLSLSLSLFDHARPAGQGRAHCVSSPAVLGSTFATCTKKPSTGSKGDARSAVSLARTSFSATQTEAVPVALPAE